MNTKNCKKCLNNLTIDNFHKDNKSSDKLKNKCKECVKNENLYYYSKDKVDRLKKMKEKNDLIKLHKLTFLFKNNDHLKEILIEKLKELN